VSKVVLITGCSSGIGKASAKLFANQGWSVVATLRKPEVATELATLPNVLLARLDVQDYDSIVTAVSDGIARFGHIDAVVNNAGFGLSGVFEATPRDNVIEQFDINVFGVMDVIRAILPHFRQNNAGLIINVSSGAGVFTLPLMSLYCASKFALEGFSEGLSWELASQNIRVKIIEPGGVLTTNFGQRGMEKAAANLPLTDYDGFVAQAWKVFEMLTARATASEDDVAQVIYTAMTDETNQLRYVATKDVEPLIQARRETSENDYIASMRAQFAEANRS
jgi:NAD(P)-dependent dehydrogenase (short-subunit alcohol dehydrogenase family)